MENTSSESSPDLRFRIGWCCFFLENGSFDDTDADEATVSMNQLAAWTMNFDVVVYHGGHNV